MGKMTVDRYGQSGPAISPLYNIPLLVRNATHLLYRFEADPDAVEDILPEHCELNSRPAVVSCLIQSTEHQSFPYGGHYVFPECVFEDNLYGFEYFLMVDTDSALSSGREFWGDSKKICHTEVVWDGTEVYTSCQRPKGLTLLSTHFRLDSQIGEDELPDFPPGLCLKMIPSAEEAAPLACHQYVKDNVRLDPRVDALGRPEIYKGVGSVMMPSETDVWPIYRLRPIRMLDAFMIRGDADFGYGEILKDFTER